MSDESRALAIPTPGGELVPPWWAQAFGPTTMYVTTLRPDDPKQRDRLMAALNDDGEPSKSHLNLPMQLVGFTISPASKVVDGELQEWVRVVLHTADGANVAGGSKGVVKSLMLIQQLYGPAPWNPPLAAKLVARDLSDGKQWYTLQVIPQPAQLEKHRPPMPRTGKGE